MKLFLQVENPDQQGYEKGKKNKQQDYDEVLRSTRNRNQGDFLYNRFQIGTFESPFCTSSVYFIYNSC